MVAATFPAGWVPRPSATAIRPRSARRREASSWRSCAGPRTVVAAARIRDGLALLTGPDADSPPPSADGAPASEDNGGSGSGADSGAATASGAHSGSAEPPRAPASLSARSAAACAASGSAAASELGGWSGSAATAGAGAASGIRCNLGRGRGGGRTQLRAPVRWSSLQFARRVRAGLVRRAARGVAARALREQIAGERRGEHLPRQVLERVVLVEAAATPALAFVRGEALDPLVAAEVDGVAGVGQVLAEDFGGHREERRSPRVPVARPVKPRHPGDVNPGRCGAPGYPASTDPSVHAVFRG